MPKSKKRRPRNGSGSELLKAKNAVRGAKNAKVALTDALQLVDSGEYLQLIKWAETLARAARRPVGEAFPSHPRSVAALPETYSPSLEEELRVMTTRLCLHRREMATFLSYRERLLIALWSTDARTADKLLENIRGDLGFSTWHLKLCVAHIAAAQGLAPQKQFVEALETERGRTPLTSIAHYVSQRNEDSTAGPRYLTRINDLLEKVSISSPLKAYYRYHLVRKVPEDAIAKSLLLAYQSQTSLIDLYEAFVALSVTAMSESLPKSDSAVYRAMIVGAELGDTRVLKSLWIAGGRKSDDLKSRNLDLDRHVLLEQSSATLSSDLLEIGDQRQVWLLAIGNLSIPASPLSAVVAALSDSMHEIGRAEASSAMLLKRVLNLDASGTEFPFYEWLADGTSGGVPFATQRHLRASLASAYLDPWDLPFIPSAFQEFAYRELIVRYGEHPVCSFVGWIAALPGCSAPDSVSKRMLSFGSVLRATLAMDYVGMAIAAEQLYRLGHLRPIAAKLWLESLLRQNGAAEAVRLASALLCENPAYYSILPIERLLGSGKWSDIKAHAKDVSLAILIDFHVKQTGSGAFGSFRRYAAEDFLFAVGVDRPSLFDTSAYEGREAEVIYFLSSVCVPEVIDLMDAFLDSRSVLEERKATLSKLIELDRNNAEGYRDELTRIATSLMLGEGIRLMDKSRIYVDKAGVMRWAKQELKEPFERYRSLHSAGVGFDRGEFATALKEYLVRQQPMPEQFLGSLKGEAEKLLFEIISLLKDNFLQSPSHGLDAYLSMRIRHGTLSGMLRGPVETHHLIAQRAGPGGRYLARSHWREILGNIGRQELDTIDAAIVRFSESFDKSIDELRNRLQIKRKQTTDGLFDLPLTHIHVHLMRDLLTRDASIEEFVEACIEVFWFLLDGSLTSVRNYIKNDFRRQIGSAFDNLAMEIGYGSGYGLSELNDATGAARGQIDAVMDAISEWFQRGPISQRQYPLEQALDVGLELVRVTYQGFSPVISKSVDATSALVLASISAIVDIVFTSFDNIYKHSGLLEPKVVIEVGAANGSTLSLRIESEVGGSIDKDRGEAQLSAIRGKITRGEYRTSAAASEGGTGLLKLKNLVDASGLRDGAVTFGYTERGTFVVNVALDLYQDQE